MTHLNDLINPVSFCGGGGGGGGGDGYSSGQSGRSGDNPAGQASSRGGGGYASQGVDRGGSVTSHGITQQGWGNMNRSLGKTTKESIDMLSNPNATGGPGSTGGDSYSFDPSYGGRDGR